LNSIKILSLTAAPVLQRLQLAEDDVVPLLRQLVLDDGLGAAQVHALQRTLQPRQPLSTLQQQQPQQ
jgi:hypothetical protein